MILVKLTDGLGNQMFQYACGRALANKFGDQLKVDTSYYNEPKISFYSRREYSLRGFQLIPNIATKSEVIIYQSLSRLFLKMPSKAKDLMYFMGFQSIKEKGSDYDQAVFKKKSSIYLQGYWQSEKYFSNVKDLIRKDFEFKLTKRNENLLLTRKIKTSQSVSIHIRRTDYVESEKMNHIHITCSMDYYQRAVRYIANKIKNPVFFIFSDDPSWVKKNMKIEYRNIVIDHNYSMPHEDMRLMSYCKHNIIANSTFSWWGAWLNKNENKIVLAPEKWYSNSSISTKDLLPKSWAKVKC